MYVICGCNRDVGSETPVAPEMKLAAKKPNRQLTSCGGRSLLSTDVKYLVPPISTQQSPTLCSPRGPSRPSPGKGQGQRCPLEHPPVQRIKFELSMMPPNLYSILPVAGEVVDRHPRHLILTALHIGEVRQVGSSVFPPYSASIPAAAALVSCLPHGLPVRDHRTSALRWSSAGSGSR